MSGISLKIKSKRGQHVLNGLSADETVGSLKNKIAELTLIPIDLMNVLTGFPPQPMDLSENDETLQNKKIINGDTLIIDEKIPVAQADPRATTATAATETSDQEITNESSLNRLTDSNASIDEGLGCEGILLKKVVPSDNSCLFTSIGYVLNGQINTDCGTFMREIIAQHVMNDKETYNEAFLGKPNSEYCEWIKRPDTWGGAIEISILSNFYGLEIAVVDITNAIINRFGEDKNYGLRVFLLFDGIHYDALYLESMTTDTPKTMFPVEDEAVYRQAEQLALEAKSSRQFTDVNKFTLKCIQCDSFLTGQVAAQQHAKATGHTNFGEV